MNSKTTKGAADKAQTADRPNIRDYFAILTKADIQRECALAARRHWGFSAKTLETQIRRFEKGGTKEKARVFCLLEDCNYHDVADALAEYDTAKAREIAARIFADFAA